MRSLRSVDDIIAGAHAAISIAGQLDRTYFVFTSDHGLHMGQFCLGPCKRQPYDTDIRIPMLLVGPGIQPQHVPSVAGMVDLAPTFLGLASSEPEELRLDGRTLLPLVRQREIALGRSSTPWRDAYLIEYFATTGVVTKVGEGDHLKDNSNNTFIGLRLLNATHNLAYFEFTDGSTDWGFAKPDFGELYDLAADPHQLTNIFRTASASLKAELHARLFTQWGCAESKCD